MNKPLIGVTRPDRGGFTQNIAIRTALALAGARTVNISPKTPRLDHRIEGLVVSGGTDLYPALFQSSELKPNYRYDHARDELEKSWINVAIASNVPILCICRGAQLLNVVQGGTLHTSIEKVFEDAKYPSSLIAKIFFRKLIVLKGATLLKTILESDKLLVNSMHSQAIDRLGSNLVVSAKENNGIVQAIEMVESRFIVGVQFHPEFLIYKRSIRRLFKSFVQASIQRDES